MRLGAALRSAWVGYRRALDHELAVAGFEDRRFPDGRVLRMCSAGSEATISQIGRELGITRQGAGKIVAGLRDRKYVTVEPSATDGREKVVRVTSRATDFLAAQRRAAKSIERRLRAELGEDAFESLQHLLVALGGAGDMRMSDYLRTTSHAGVLGHFEE